MEVVGSQKVASKNYVNTENNQMTSIGAIFTSTYVWYKSSTSSTQHMCHACHTHVHFQGTCMFLCAHMCGLNVYMCELHMPCPHTVIHTRVYCYKMLASANSPRNYSHLSAKILPIFSCLLHRS